MSDRVTKVPAVAWEQVEHLCGKESHNARKFSQEIEMIVWMARNPPGGIRPATFEDIADHLRDAHHERVDRVTLGRIYRRFKDRYQWKNGKVCVVE